jgi:hypothetical protein
VKNGLTLGALAFAVLAMAQMASAQLQAAAKARGYYGAAASPGPADAVWLAPGITEIDRAAMLSTNKPRDYIPANSGRAFSYAPAPVPARTAPAQSVRPAPQVAAAAPATSAPVRRYSYSYQPRYYRGTTMDRVLGTQPENRNAAAKAQGDY